MAAFPVRPVRFIVRSAFCLLVLWLFSACSATDPIHSFDESRLVSAAELQAWHEDKAAGGPTFSGSPAWLAHMQFIEDGLRERGVVNLRRDTLTYRRWFAPDQPTPAQRRLVIGGRDIPVAAYWAYSGATGPQGVTAPLVYYKKRMPREELTGRIVVFEVKGPPASMAPAFAADHEFMTEDLEGYDPSLVSDQWFQGNFVTRFGRFDEVLKDSGAAGGIVIFDMSAERANGLYTFPLLNEWIIGVPGIYVDREAGAIVRAAAHAQEEATLVLVAEEQDTETWFLSGVLPGRHYGSEKDEAILLVTHSEGPNLTQENGTFVMLTIVDYFAQLPQEKRERSLYLLFDPQHYTPGRHTVPWYAQHPQIVDSIVASIGVEQFGQREYAITDGVFGPTDRAEPTLLFVQENEALLDMAIAAVQSQDLPRTEIRVPSRGGQGMWAGLGDFAIKFNKPGFAHSSGMSGYWTTTAGIESFDVELARRQTAVLIELTGGLMTADLDEIAVPVVDPKKNPAMSPGTRR